MKNHQQLGFPQHWWIFLFRKNMHLLLLFFKTSVFHADFDNLAFPYMKFDIFVRFDSTSQKNTPYKRYGVNIKDFECP